MEPATPQLRGLQEPGRQCDWRPAKRRVHRGDLVFRGCSAVCLSMYGSVSVHIIYKQVRLHLIP
jgi:hypothetical protein